MLKLKYKPSLYFTLALTITFTVLVVLALHTSSTYNTIKTDTVLKMRTDSIKTIDVLEKNIATFIESYAVNEYDKLLNNEMKLSQHLAIIVKDYNMGKILSSDAYISGKIKLSSGKIVDFDPSNKQHKKLTTKALFFQSKKVLSSKGEEIGSISIYISGKNLENKLNRLIKDSIFDFILITFILTFLLYLSIYYFIIKPISNISYTLSIQDNDGIPINRIDFSGPKEISSLAKTINFMLDAIKKSRLKIEQHNKELDYTAKHDMLTDLPNRFLFNELIQKLLYKTKEDNTHLALLYIDLDGFKDINDKHGHEAGDLVLIKISQKIKTLLNKEDFVARLGGDEFVVALANLDNTKNIMLHLNRFLEVLKQNIPNPKDASQISTITSSIGVTFYPQQNEIGPEALLRQAAQAMYDAKKLGKNQYHIFNLDIDSSIKEHLHIIQDFEQSLKQNHFVLHYQPKADMRTNKIIGFETLLRWEHPQRGMLYPDQFLPQINTEKELMLSLGEWVVTSAFNQFSKWKEAGYDFSLSINISAHEFKEIKTFNLLKSLLEKYPNISPSEIEFEILETHAFDDILQAQRMIKTFQKLGFKIALDDFGTGYSTLSYLKDLSINTLKIDKSFVMDMLEDRASLSILEATLGLAEAFGCDVIAEGVESIEHGNTLIQLGCYNAQGYVLSKPMPSNEVIEWLKSYKGYKDWEENSKKFFHDNSALYATVEHKQWIKNLKKYLDDPVNNVYPELDKHKCSFAKWLKNDAKKYFSSESVKNIDDLHGKIHALANEVVNNKEIDKNIYFQKIMKLHEKIKIELNKYYGL
ncbi:EAL domain-containing protein [Sulfurimonas lithotrophica]|uniref:EAL domain-containing protein n=1 Tax=Sulfurimonas lithotrophica TaxID=2590022 RepID=A0A5P8NXX1_9BACT|nr:EAL domain-containing protein [Sulfurimonas lithotrophica]QFR48281.1 EAL domain-containing protein [Sulfurimonas lithotrophica]